MRSWTWIIPNAMLETIAGIPLAKNIETTARPGVQVRALLSMHAPVGFGMHGCLNFLARVVLCSVLDDCYFADVMLTCLPLNSETVRSHRH